MFIPVIWRYILLAIGYATIWIVGFLIGRKSAFRINS